MAPVPLVCQPIADAVAALEARDQQIQAQLPTLNGAGAWAALAELGQVRTDLERRRAELDECIKQNSAALQGNLVVIDVTGGAPPRNRVATLWEITPTGATQRESVPVKANTFSFAGPLPATFGLSVATGGDPTILGPDFRSAELTADAIPSQGALRAEVVLGPVVRFEQADLARLAADFVPTTSHIEGGTVDAEVSITAVDARLANGAVEVRATGQVVIRAVFGVNDRGPFSASATLRLVPTGQPAAVDLVDLLSVADMQVALPGIAGVFVDPILPLIRTFFDGLLKDHLRAILRTELPAAVSRTFALAGLPPGVAVSVRRLSIDPTAIEFQPALGAIGDSLSTFNAPAAPPP